MSARLLAVKCLFMYFQSACLDLILIRTFAPPPGGDNSTQPHLTNIDRYSLSPKASLASLLKAQLPYMCMSNCATISLCYLSPMIARTRGCTVRSRFDRAILTPRSQFIGAECTGASQGPSSPSTTHTIYLVAETLGQSISSCDRPEPLRASVCTRACRVHSQGHL